MGLGQAFLSRAFGQPRGLLGRLGGRLMARMNRPCAERVLTLLEVNPQDRVLEIGFGSGVGIALAARVAKSVAGADPSADMVAQAKARNAGDVATGHVDLREAPAEKLPFNSGTFDKVFAINSMQLWADRGAGLREVRRVLEPGGRLALGFTANSGQGKSGLVEALSAAGFDRPRLVESETCICALAGNP